MAELEKYLALSNIKLKKLKRNIKQVRIERNSYKGKLEEIENILNNIEYYYDRYDKPSDVDYGKITGKLELKEELVKIINDSKRNIL